MKNIIKSLIPILFLFVIACSSNQKLPYDLNHYSQNPFDYLNPETADSLICSPELQAKTDSLSMNRYFYCWSDSLLSDTPFN